VPVHTVQVLASRNSSRRLSHSMGIDLSLLGAQRLLVTDAIATVSVGGIWVHPVQSAAATSFVRGRE